MITLEDVNTWIELFDFPVPILIDTSVDVDNQLFQVDSSNHQVLLKFVPKTDRLTGFDEDGDYTAFDVTIDTYDLYYRLTFEDSSVKTILVYMDFSIDEIAASVDSCDFIPTSNIKRNIFEDDDLSGRKLYVDVYNPNVTKINSEDIISGTDGSKYVPLYVLLDGVISCTQSDVEFTPSLNVIYEPPVIMNGGPAYIGNNNRVSDLVDCPVNFTAYYNNKPVEDIFIPRDTTKESIRVKVVTKSMYPYIPTEKWITVPLEYKSYSDVSDLNKYTYIRLDSNVSNATWNISGDVTLFSTNNKLTNVKIVNKGTLVLDTVDLENCKVYNENNATIFNNENTGLYVVNNDNLTIENTVIDTPTIINNGSFDLIENTITTDDKTEDLPLIHSSTNNYKIMSNTFTLDNDYTNNSLMIIRTSNVDKEVLTRDNTFVYDAELTVDETTYTIAGNGLAYGNIDDDTLYFYNLEVNENV